MKKALLVLAALHLARLLLAPAFDLAPQEAYYFLYAQHPALSYFDHPPAVAWAIMPFAAALGRSVLAPRLAAWTIAILTFALVAALARRTLPRGRRPWALLLLGTAPLASVVGLIITPDAPLLLFWALALLLLHRAIFRGERLAWVGAGLAMGLAFDAKYTAVFLPLGMLLFLVLAPRHRRWLATPWPWAALALGQAAALPVYLWNAQHGFASLLFQSAGRAGSVHGFGLVNFGKLVGTQSFLLLPPLLLTLVWALVAAVRISRRGRERRSRETVLFLACFSLPLVAGFTGLSFFALVKPNWLLPAYLTGILLAVRLVSWRPLWKANLALAALVLPLMAAEVVLHLVPVRSDDTWFGWRMLAAETERRASRSGAGFVFADDEYKTTAELRFYSDLPAYAGNVIGRRALQFDYLGEDLAALRGQDALFLDSRPRDRTPDRIGSVPEKLAGWCREIVEDEPIVLRNRGEIVRKFGVYRCLGYLGSKQ